MNTSHKNNHINEMRTFSAGVAISSLLFGMCLLALPAKAQDDANQAPPQDQQTQGNPQIQGAPQQQPPSNAGPGPGPAQNNQQAGPVANEPQLPATLTIPAGEEIRVRVNQWISSDKNQPGDRFSGTLEQPVVANGWVVARRGQSITGQITVAQKSSHGGVSQLGVELDQIALVDGQTVPAKTQMVKGTPQPTPPGRDVNIVGSTTGVGAVVGGIVGGGAGALAGAGLGATAGLMGILSTRGNPTIIYPESVLTFRLDNPVQVSTAGSEVAFQPVGPDDYGQQQGGPGQPQLAQRPPAYPYPYAYYGAPYPYPYYGYYYPAPFAFGVYGRIGPRYYYRGRFIRR
jgi:hypothetical protein